MRTILMMAALLAAAPVAAQEPPSTIGVGVHTGTFEEAGDVDGYRVRLEQGKDYALGVTVAGDNGGGQWTVRGPTGTVLGRADAGDGDYGWSFEFRAGRTGYFTIEGRHIEGEPPVGYSFRLHRDCRDDPKTRCQIRPGATQSHTLAFGEGVDLVRLIDLKEGRTYTATISNGASLAVTDSTGAVVSWSGTFKASRSTVFLRILGEDAFGGAGPYKLSLR